MKVNEFDRNFDAGGDLTTDLDLSKLRTAPSGG